MFSAAMQLNLQCSPSGIDSNYTNTADVLKAPQLCQTNVCWLK